MQDLKQVSDPWQYLYSTVVVNKLDKLPSKVSLAFLKEALIFGSGALIARTVTRQEKMEFCLCSRDELSILTI